MHAGIGPKPKDSDFSDLLGGNFSSKSNANAGPRTLKDMRADSDINNALDPDRAKVGIAFNMHDSMCIHVCCFCLQMYRGMLLLQFPFNVEKLLHVHVYVCVRLVIIII